MSWVDIDLALRKIEGQQVRFSQQITFGGNSQLYPTPNEKIDLDARSQFCLNTISRFTGS